MAFTSQIFAIKELPGVPIGYGETYVTETPCRVGIVAAAPPMVIPVMRRATPVLMAAQPYIRRLHGYDDH